MTSIENLAKEWAVNSNEVLRVSLYSGADDKEPVTFGPVFTYPIYGDAETIYGFKDLTIDLKFDETSMLPLLECSWSKRLIEDSEDPKKTLLEYLPEDTSMTEEQWLEKRKEPFEIPGTLVESFTDKEGDEYNIYRGRGVGGAFYETLVQIFLKDKAVREISVEDPSEAFDDLRDRCDLTRLYENGTWTNSDLIKSVHITPEWIEATREHNKMTTRQFDRCLEMALLKFADIDADPTVARRYRLLVKKRLYLRNKEPLDEMSKEEKKEKLEETFEVLKEDYLRILSKVKFDKKRSAVSTAEEESSFKKQKI